MPRTTDFRLHDILTFRVIRPESGLRDVISNPDVNYRALVTGDVIEPDITLTIGPFSPDLSHCLVVDNKYYVREDYIFFQDSYKIARWSVAVSGFESGKVHIQLQCSMFGLIFSIGILELMMRVLAACRGCAFIHSFGVTKGGRGYLFPARSGVGKTISSVYFLSEGYNIISDNFVLIKKGEMYSFPTPMLIFSYNLRGPLRERISPQIRRALILKNWLYKATLGYAKFLTPVQLQEAFPGQQTGHSRYQHLIYTMAGESFSAEKDMDKSGLADTFCAINKFETLYFLRMMEAYALVFPGSLLSGHWQRVKSVFQECITLLPCHRLQVPENYEYGTFIKIREFTESL